MAKNQTYRYETNRKHRRESRAITDILLRHDSFRNSIKYGTGITSISLGSEYAASLIYYE